MVRFRRIKAGKQSLAQRKRVAGVGINDADYMTQYKDVKCPYYRHWVNVLQRCYNPAIHVNRPHYQGCSVCEDWLLFSNFARWMQTQKWKGKHLDKDIMLPGNKVYSPETCVFVSNALNCLLTSHDCARGKYVQGVSWNKKGKKFQAECSVKGSAVFLGWYDTEEKASAVYRKFKAELITKTANRQKDGRIKAGLLLHAKQYYETTRFVTDSMQGLS